MSTIRTARDASTGQVAASPCGGDRLAVDPAQFRPLDAPALRLSEVALRLAISRAGAYRLVRAGHLRGVQVGQTWRVLRADFETYLAERRAEADRRYRRARGER